MRYSVEYWEVLGVKTQVVNLEFPLGVAKKIVEIIEAKLPQIQPSFSVVAPTIAEYKSAIMVFVKERDGNGNIQNGVQLVLGVAATLEFLDTRRGGG